MAEDVYPYDQVLYGRSYLNCYQRQGLVMLAERLADVPLLFGASLVSSDDMLEQIIRLERPKYDFQSTLLSPDNLGHIGVTRKYVPFDTWADARETVLETVSTQGYAIPFIDVYYLPHTPEYRVDHVVHTVTLTEYHPLTREWSILDDNRASVLCRYRYSEQVIAEAYDNGKLRHVSWFPTGGYDVATAVRSATAAFAGTVERFADGRALLTGVGDLLTTPWIAAARALTLLYDTFALYEGSRTCLREFVLRQPGYADTAPALAGVVGLCKDLRNQLLIGKAIGRVDVARVDDTCTALAAAEDELLVALRERAARAARPAEVVS